MLRMLSGVSVLVLVALLQGCAGVVVGGAAAGASIAHDRRSAGTFVDDEIIELKATKRLIADKELFDQSHINITSYNNILLLSGEAPTDVLRSKAFSLVSDIPKVRKVHNELVLAAPSSMLTRSSDTWITTKVKTNLFNIKNIEGFDPTRIKVVSENGTVFLMGIVTRSEAETVVEASRRVKGVQRVVKLFEYLN
ncbi:BON domain-containing protein [Sulfuriflexus mobilis]|uniref:BON domain-containing protein n=1 Tax=Sulfuriflexus mobilis TaxID=1811807 RepID=UPI001E399830|nr:BON domain-containing protein [Sulfuriflexus mobilis]